jgi:hypothetical protein
MSEEVRNQHEGALRWVQASGVGAAWATASGAASGLLGFVTNFALTSGRTVQTIYDRGKPNHHKLVSEEAIDVSFDLQYGITAQYPPVNVTGGGASMPMIHLELRMSAPEQGSGSAQYIQVYGVALNNQAFAEATNANTLAFKGMGLGMNGPTASGYMA